MTLTKFERANGSPNREWRYMSDIYSDATWWEHKSLTAHIVIQRPKDYKPKSNTLIQWEVTFYRSGGPTVKHYSTMPLPNLKRVIIARELQRDRNNTDGY